MRESHHMPASVPDNSQDRSIAPSQGQPTAGTGSSVASLVCGIASLALLIIPLMGIIFGVGGIMLARTTFDTLSKLHTRSGTPHWLAMAGLITGIVGTLIGIGYIVRIVVGAATTPQ
jgi:uncharacterized membrane protein HdeD (DUF308 family)